MKIREFPGKTHIWVDILFIRETAWDPYGSTESDAIFLYYSPSKERMYFVFQEGEEI
jgi:hypothetical protein